MIPVYILVSTLTDHPLYYNDEIGPKLRHYWLLSRGSIDRKPIICKRPECHSLGIL